MRAITSPIIQSRPILLGTTFVTLDVISCVLGPHECVLERHVYMYVGFEATAHVVLVRVA